MFIVSIRANRFVIDSVYTRISMKIIFGFGGIYERTVGMRATKAIIKAAILAILSATT